MRLTHSKRALSGKPRKGISSENNIRRFQSYDNMSTDEKSMVEAPKHSGVGPIFSLPSTPEGAEPRCSQTNRSRTLGARSRKKEAQHDAR